MRSRRRTTRTSATCSCSRRPTPTTPPSCSARIRTVLPCRVRARARRQRRASVRRSTRCCGWSRATTASSSLCHDDIAPDPRAVRILVAELFRSNAGIVGPKLDRLGQPARAPARRPRPRPVRRGRPDRRPRRGRPGAARRSARRVRAPVRLHARAGRPVPGARRVRPVDLVPRRRRRVLLARPPHRRSRRRRSRRPRAPPRAAGRAPSRSQPPHAAEPAPHARGRHAHGWLAPARALAPARRAHARRGRRRPVHRPARRGALVAAGAGRPHPAHRGDRARRRRRSAASGRCPSARCSACRGAAARGSRRTCAARRPRRSSAPRPRCDAGARRRSGRCSRGSA